MSRFLITGHTGFKGTWLMALLQSQGHVICGVSDEVRPSSLFARFSPDELVNEHHLFDIRDFNRLSEVATTFKPDFIIHMAAQPLVSVGYRNPVETFDININGTLNIIRAAESENVSRTLIVTSDKSYRPHPLGSRLVESDPLGGYDPYSASKSAADILATSFAQLDPWKGRLFVARGGNVIGGGDDSTDRLMVDISASWSNSTKVRLRNPSHVRPWQHVLDCVWGYIQVLQLETPPISINIGPTDEVRLSVLDVLRIAEASMGVPLLDEAAGSSIGMETEALSLDVSHANSLGITNIYPQKQAVQLTLDWLKLAREKGPSIATRTQVADYLSATRPA